MTKHRLSESSPTKLRADKHSFHFTVIRVEHFYPTTPHQLLFVAHHKEDHALAQQLFHTVRVPALSGIRMGHQMLIELADKLNRIRRIRRDFCNLNSRTHVEPRITRIINEKRGRPQKSKKAPSNPA